MNKTCINESLGLACLILLPVVIGGCTSARSAAKAALTLTLNNVQAYKLGLQTRIDAERTAYAELSRVVETAAVESADLSREAQEYIALSRMADSILVEKKGVAEGGLVDFLITYDDTFDASLLAGAEAKVRQEARERTAVGELSREQAALDGVEEQLMLATRQRSAAQEFQFLLDYAQGVNTKLQALKKLDAMRKAAIKPATQPTTTTTSSAAVTSATSSM